VIVHYAANEVYEVRYRQDSTDEIELLVFDKVASNDCQFLLIYVSVLVLSLCKQIQVAVINVLKHTDNEKSAYEVFLENDENGLHAKLELEHKIVVMDVRLEIVPQNIPDADIDSSQPLHLVIQEVLCP
jgi:hypothetical protein